MFFVFFGLCTLFFDHNHLSRFNIPDIFGADDIKSAGFTGDHPCFPDSRQCQRPESIRVSDGNQLLIGLYKQAVGALNLVHRVAHLINRAVFLTSGNEVEDEFGVGGTLKQDTFFCK